MNLPVPPNKGEPIRAELIRQMLDYMRRITPVAGPNIKVSIGPGGAKIEGTPGGTAAVAVPLAPWTVRLHKTDDDVAGQWEIYLPPGCMSVGGNCEPLNKAASEKSGHADDPAGWYALDLDETAGDPTSTETDGEGNTANVREYSIIAHAKTSAKVYGVDDLNASARRLLWVEARKTPSAAELASQTGTDRVFGTWGDEFAQIVGTVTITTEGTDISRRIVVSCSTPISVAARARTNFDLVWYFDFDEDGSLEVKKVYCLRQFAAVAGITVTGDTMTDVTDASTIYARVDATSLGAGANIVQVVKDPDGVYISQPRVVWLQLYAVTSNAVTADYRSQSLTNLQLYHA